MKTILRASAIATFAVLLSPVANGATVGYWRFEEGVAGSAASGFGSIVDSSGNGNNGTPVNGPVYSANVPTNPIPQTGASNKLSIGFNGSNQRIFVPDSSTLALTHSLTVEASINPNSTAGGTQVLMRGDDRVGLDPYQMSLVNGTITFSITNASDVVATVAAPFNTLNQWSEIAATLNDATGVMNLYVNGALVSTTTTTVRPFATLDPSQTPGIGIGNVESASYNEYFNGLIDEVRISDQALSPSQFLDAPEPSSLSFSLSLASLGLLSRRRPRPTNNALAEPSGQ